MKYTSLAIYTYIYTYTHVCTYTYIPQEAPSPTRRPGPADAAFIRPLCLPAAPPSCDAAEAPRWAFHGRYETYGM